MNGFGTDEPVPEWLGDQFDLRTSLPRGPLEHLPVPLEGHITGAKALAPSDKSSAHWQVTAQCVETLDHTLKFYEEYLPLSGYRMAAIGSYRQRRSWIGKTPPPVYLIVLRRGHYLGLLTITSQELTNLTLIEIEMGHAEDGQYASFIDSRAIAGHSEIQWQMIA